MLYYIIIKNVIDALMRYIEIKKTVYALMGFQIPIAVII